MKIWLTSPFDDNGIREIDTDSDPVGDIFSYTADGLTITYQNWYKEGKTWHRTKAAAIVAAENFRLKRIADAVRTIAHLSSLAPISEATT